MNDPNSPLMWIVSGLLIAACSGLALASPARRAFRCLPGAIHAIGRLHLLEVAVFVIGAIVGAIPLLLHAVPPPSIHDEFAYLLGADTFAHGRLTNPTPALADHFITMHELFRPTYQSKYPPANSLALAAGQMLGSPIIGAFLAASLAAVACCWMLRAVLPARWAFAGGLIAALHPVGFMWGQSYMGGSMAALGAAMLFGSTLRAVKRPTVWHGAIFSLGGGILFLSRPFEGLITTLLLLAWAVFKFRDRRALLKTMLAAMAVGVLIGGWSLYYNWRVTGSALTMPYSLYSREFQISPTFYWSPARPFLPVIDQKTALFWMGDLAEWQRQTSLPGFVLGAIDKLKFLFSNYLAGVLLPLVVIATWTATRRSIFKHALLIFLGLPIIQLCCVPYLRGHYLSPMYPMAIALITLSLRQFSRQWNHAHAVNGAVVGVVFCVMLFCAGQIHAIAQKPDSPGRWRENIIQQLQSSGGKHLVIVNYIGNDQMHFEWVFNSADIDSQKVIFARSLGETRDRELITHYKDRKIWHLLVQNRQVRLLPGD